MERTDLSIMRRLLGRGPHRAAAAADFCESCGVCDARCRARSRREAVRSRAALAREVRW